MIWVNNNLVYDISNTEQVIANKKTIWARPFFKWMNPTNTNVEYDDSQWRKVIYNGTQTILMTTVRYNVPIELETTVANAGSGVTNLTLDTLKDPSDVYYNETSTNFRINGTNMTRTVYFHFKNALDGKILKTMQVIQGNSNNVLPVTYNTNLAGTALNWANTSCILFTSLPTKKIDVSGFQKWTVPRNNILRVEFLHSMAAYTADGEFTTISTGDTFYVMWGSGNWSTDYQTNNQAITLRQNTSIILYA